MSDKTSYMIGFTTRLEVSLEEIEKDPVREALFIAVSEVMLEVRKRYPDRKIEFEYQPCILAEEPVNF